jgi:putative sugar O-methyltransferase
VPARDTPPSTSPLGRLADDWLPPRLVRGLRRRRSATSDLGDPSPPPALTPRRQKPAERTRQATRRLSSEPVALGDDPRWARLTERVLAGLETCDPGFRPTNFWSPGVQKLLAEMDERGLGTFKSWPQAFFWFYPTYGRVIDPPAMKRIVNAAAGAGPPGIARWIRPLLKGVSDARRDYDAARLTWNQDNWPMDLESFGESEVGMPVQTYHLAGAESSSPLTRPYLNYLLCMAALSRHVEAPPRGFLELGGGYGVLGEIVMSRDPGARYVNCDIPPLITVSSYYLTELFGHERVLTYDERVADDGPIEVPRSACLPNWRIGDVRGDFDVFVNSYSFQEMEPHVVERYVDIVAGLGVRYAVSLNSRAGKVIAKEEGMVGVKEQVTSPMIIELFEQRGYELCATYNRPLLLAAGELAVLRRR